MLDLNNPDEAKVEELLALITDLLIGSAQNTLSEEDPQSYERLRRALADGAYLEAEFFEAEEQFDSEEVGAGKVFGADLFVRDDDGVQLNVATCYFTEQGLTEEQVGIIDWKTF
ncbi:MAG: hypothetical protein J6M93_07085 [Succinivibrio sp.]|nr:hypothetical protein [Succinivibrio sp.]